MNRNCSTSHRAGNGLLLIRTLLLAALGLYAGGCVSPDPKPFQEYATATKSAGDAIDGLLSKDIQWSHEKYVQSVLDGTVTLKDSALLYRSKPFTVTFPSAKPTFYNLQDVRTTLVSLNDATEKYVNTLCTLAGSDSINPQVFDAMAKDADASLNAVVQHLNAKAPDNAVPLFSVGSAEVAKLVIEQRRHAALVKVLAGSQAAIDGYCMKCIDLLKILDQSLATDYDGKALAIEQRFHKSHSAQDVEDLINLNDEYLTTVRSLMSAKAIYETLPKAHAELLQSVNKRPTGLQAIRSLYAESKHLKDVYDATNTEQAGSK